MHQLKELKRLQKMNERHRRAVYALTLVKFIMREVAKGDCCAPQGGVTASAWCGVSLVSANAVLAGFYSNIDRHTAVS